MLCGQFCHHRRNQIPTFPSGVSVGPHTQKLSESSLAKPQLSANDSQPTRIALNEGAKASEGESIEGSRLPEAGEGRYRPEKCLRVYEVEGGALVVFWRLSNWMAPVLGAACKELLNRSEENLV